MNNKILSLVVLATILLSYSVLASSMIQLSPGSNPTDLRRNINTTSFQISNSYAGNINISMSASGLQVNDGRNHFATLAVSPSTLFLNNLIPGNSTTVNAALTVDPNFLVNPKTYTFPAIVVNAVDSGNSSITDSQNLTYTYTQDYCRYGDIGGVDITSLTDQQLDNKNQWEWHASDNIELTTRVRNNNGNDLDMILEYGLYDVDDNSFVDISADTISFSVNDGSSKENTIDFQIPSSSDINPDHTYKFYVKAYEDGNEKGVCAERTPDTNINLVQDSNSVTLTNIDVPATATCGDTIDLKAKVNNNGVNDQKQVLVTAYNNELGMDLRKVYSSFSSGDEATVDLPFTIPQKAAEKSYTISFTTFFRYDSSNGGCSSTEDTACYDKNSADDLSKTYSANIAISGCTPPVTVQTDVAKVAASLDSAANAGQPIAVKATVTNIGNSTNTYNILATGYDNFATLNKIDPQSFTLDAGQSKDVLITLNANSDASGDYTFSIKAISGSKVKEELFSLPITAKTGFSLNLSSLTNNWFIWIIVLVNVVLIVLIVIVAIRIARK